MPITSGEPCRISQVSESLTAVNNSIDGLSEKIQTLCGRLERVLIPLMPQPTTQTDRKDNVPVRVPLSNDILSMQVRLDQQIEIVQSVLKRIEL